jgi:hypothetical protein
MPFWTRSKKIFISLAILGLLAVLVLGFLLLRDLP